MDGLRSLFHVFFNPAGIADSFPEILRVGLPNTLILASLTIVFSVSWGLIVALALISSKPYLRIPARIYVDVLRGLPGLLTIALIGFGLPISGIRPFGRNVFAYAILALSLISGAYICEIFRSGIQSIERGQMDAARSLGLSHWKAMRYVVVPQGIRRVLPALSNQFIIIIKETSLVFVLGLLVSERELFSVASDRSLATGTQEALVAAGICYLALTIPLTYLVNWLDRRLREGNATRAGAGPGPTRDSRSEGMATVDEPQHG